MQVVLYLIVVIEEICTTSYIAKSSSYICSITQRVEWMLMSNVQNVECSCQLLPCVKWGYHGMGSDRPKAPMLIKYTCTYISQTIDNCAKV